ncbi:hypothetical protein [Bradyrhizobium liaoningense]
MAADPLILFTGLPGAGVSTRVAALHVALERDNGFRGYEIDKDQGNPNVDNIRKNQLELLDLMMRRGESSAHGMPLPRRSASTNPGAPFFLGIESGMQKNRVEVWERDFSSAIRTLEQSDYEYDGVVISLPVQIERSAPVESQLDSLIRPLRKKHWIDFKNGAAPWVIFDLTCYETLFCQIVTEMLEREAGPDDPQSVFQTPFSFASRPDIQSIAVKTFCQRWLGDNELTHLANAERQRCSFSFPPRVMIQVSSAWGFLTGSSGPATRQPANCRHPAETADGLQCPRFPSLTELQRSVLTTLKVGVEITTDLDGQDMARSIEDIAATFSMNWRPIGVVEPIPSIVWRAPAPNMFWVPEMMSNGSARD